MFNRLKLSGLGLALVLASPLAALAGDGWETTNDEAGTRMVAPARGTPFSRAALPDAGPLTIGTLSIDRQYVYGSEQSGWQLRPMQYRREAGRLVHVDDPAGHMNALADTRSTTPAQRAALARSGGS